MSSVEISGTVGKSLSNAFDGIIKDGGPDKLQGIQSAMDWYDRNKSIFDNISQDEIDRIPDAIDVINLARETKKGRDAFLSKLANIVVEKIMDKVSLPFVGSMIDEIKIKTKGERKDLTFNMNFTSSVLKPYMEFILKIEGQVVKSAKLVFETAIKCTMKEINFAYGKDSSTITLGKLEGTLSVSANFTVPDTQIKQSKELGSRSFDVDLSRFQITW